MGCLKKLGVILYKNLLLRRTQWLITGLEVFLPIFFVFITAYMQPGSECFIDDDAPDKIESGEVHKIDPNWCPSGGNTIYIRYTPHNTATTEAVTKMRQKCGGQIHLSEYLEETSLLKSLNVEDDIGIVFPDGLQPLNGKSPGARVTNAVISYTIRIHSTKLPTTKQLFPEKFGSTNLALIRLNKDHLKDYSLSRFLSIQNSLDQALIEMITGQQSFTPDVSLEMFDKYLPPRYPKPSANPSSRFPERGIYENSLYRGSPLAVELIPPLLSFSILFSIPTLTRNVVSEKQTGIGELLKSAGVSGVIQWLGWMINSLVPMLVSISICTVFLCCRVAGEKNGCLHDPIFAYSDWTLVWVFLFLYIVSTIAMCFLICSVVKKPTLATFIAVIISVVSPFLYLTRANKIMMSIFPNCALTFAYSLIDRADRSFLDESEKVFGARWDWELFNHYYDYPDFSTGQRTQDVTMLQIMGMMIADVVVYSVLALYFDGVLPSEFGVRRPWHFFNFEECFKRMRPKKGLASKKGPEEEGVTTVDRQVAALEEGAGEMGETNTVASNEGAGTLGPAAEEKAKETSIIADDPSFEPEVGKNTPVGIDVQNIYKSFGVKKAVNGVSLKLYEGDIFALLGHNGAGKTTLISVLTGFYSPTNGTAVVNGHDIRKDMEKARKSLGVCPQHNMLFDNISVTNQLVIFGMLRGMNCNDAKIEAEDLLFKMNLTEKEYTKAKKLSGGQKRKLSLAMALIGGTKVVVLDEPTSGMDPQARREIWDLLLELRAGRTILLTTHFMEEADVLGDRIGIMAAGKMQCCGSSAFLKNYYGTGYTLKLTLQQSQEEVKQENESKTSVPVSPAAGKVLSLVQKRIPDASIKKDIKNDGKSGQIFLTLPSGTTTTSTLTQVFSDLNGNRGSLGIQTMGLQQTTMDEVFLRVGEIAEEDNEKGPTPEYGWKEHWENYNTTGSSYTHLAHRQFIALLRKKWILFKNRWISCLFEVIISLLLILGATLILQNGPGGEKNSGYSFNISNETRNSRSSGAQPKLLLSLNKYSSPLTYYYSDDTTFGGYMKNIIGPSGQEITSDPAKFKEDLALVGKSQLKKYKRNMIIALKKEGATISTMFNSFPYHAAPLALNTANNVVLRGMDASANNRIEVAIHPWSESSKTATSASSARSLGDPKTQDDPWCDVSIFNTSDRSIKRIIVGSSVLILLAFILFTSPFIMEPIEERILHVKQLALMNLLQPVVFWASHLLFDYTLYFIMALLTLLLVFLVELLGVQFLTIASGGGVLLLILMCFGFSAIMMTYLLSLRSSTVAGGFTLVLLMHLVTGVVLGSPLLLVRGGNSGSSSTLMEVIIAVFTVFCYCFPSTPTLMALGTYTRIAYTNVQLKCIGSTDFIGYLKWSERGHRYNKFGIPRQTTTAGVVQELFFVLLTGFVYLLLLMIIEYKICRRICPKETQPQFEPSIYDDDVFDESLRVNMLVQTRRHHNEAVVVQDLSKAYGGFAAVNQLSFDVHCGECFGLLGVNGAGKTTVFKMITTEEIPSGGTVYGGGTTSVEHPRRYVSRFGYCPQFDALFPVFTGREMLELFGVLRGLAFVGAKNEAIKWLHRFGLFESADVKCGNYSGGMKRRLSTGMALIGDPPIILLDEPTSGVDPVSRHQFWSVLEKVKNAKHSIILTSHSMDECEAMCDRLGIMVNGQFQCFGEVEHLKNKFAQGYSLTIKLKPGLEFGTPEVDENLTKFQEKINETFQPCSLKDKHENLLQYHLENPSVSWDSLFKMLEDVKKEFEHMVEDYSVNETSLEEVFLAFARMQCDERKVEVTTCAQVCSCSC